MFEKFACLTLIIALIPNSQGNRNICYDELGCITSSFVMTTPSSRSDIGTTFQLFTREESMKATTLNASDVTTITSSNFKASRPTKFIVHGFKGYGNGTSYQVLINNLLTHGDYNVINVVWGKGAQGIYLQAAVNTFVVGLEVAYMIRTLQDKVGVKLGDIHLIGHSLGAHVMGHAGNKVPGVSRITGLDPAGPLFENWGPNDRLDASDAKFVDVVHTSGSSGIQRTVGHLDFYPNGGRLQPGCGSSLVDVLDGCSHKLAIDLFADSMMTATCQSVAYECASFAQFQQGQCASCGSDNSKCAQFGISADSYPLRSTTGVKLYFATTSTSPYCQYHYRVKIALAKPTRTARWVNGMLSITIEGDNGIISDKQLTSGSENFVFGKEKTYLLLDSLNVGPIHKISLKWTYVSDLLRPSTLCALFCSRSLHVGSVEVSQLNSYPETARLANTYKLCPTDPSHEVVSSGSLRAFSLAC